MAPVDIRNAPPFASDRLLQREERESTSGKPIAKGGVAVPFPWKLHCMLEDMAQSGDTSIVTWLPHGRAFIVHKPDAFVAQILPKYFCHSKYASFQRQLNLYSFSRFSHGRDKGAYYHKFFVRGQEHLCHQMVRRKIKGTQVRRATQPMDEPNFYAQNLSVGSGKTCAGVTPSPPPEDASIARTIFMNKCPVHVSRMVAFLNEGMRREGLTGPNENAIISCQDMGTVWQLQTSREGISQSLVLFNEIVMENGHTVRLCLPKGVETPRYSNWYQYYLNKYGRNDPILERLLYLKVDPHYKEDFNVGDFLYEKSLSMGLLTKDPIQHCRKVGDGTFCVVLCHTAEAASQLLWLNDVKVDDTISLRIKRHHAYVGPGPTHRTFEDFAWNRTRDRKKDEATGVLEV